MLMDKDIRKLIKLLNIRQRKDLASLISESKSEVRESGQFGSQWNSIISDFIFYCPVEKYIKLKELSDSDKELLLEIVREIYPIENDAPEIVNIAFRIIDDEIDESINSNQNESEPKSSFIDKSIRVFICYSSEDGILAGNVKSYLEKYFGLEVFLAHEDIDAGEEWEKIIAENLKSTDIFIPLLSPNFESSKFTNQETGMAFILDKRIIPVTISPKSSPYGFIRKIQSLKLNIPDDEFLEWIAFGEKVIEAIGKDPLFQSSTKNSIVRAFKGSSSFSFTRRMVHILKNYKPYSEWQVNQIIRGYLENINIADESYQIPSFIREVVEEYIKFIDKNTLELLPKTILPKIKTESNDIPF